MAIDLPDSPTNGQTSNGFTYNSTKGYWTATSSGGGGGSGASVTSSDTAPSSPSAGDLWFNSSNLTTFIYYNDGSSSQWVPSSPGGGGGSSGGSSVTVSDTAPSSPSAGDLWYNSSDLKMYIYYSDGSSSQWVSTSIPGAAGSDGTDGTDGTDGSGGVTSYANLAAFPSSGNTASDLAYAQDTKALYMWDGTEWDRVYTGANEIPTWTTEANSSYIIAPSGNTDITVVATDKEGFPLTYSYDTNPTNPPQLSSVTQSSPGVFRVNMTSTAGNFTFRTIATDGVHAISKSSSIQQAYTSAQDVVDAGNTTDGLYLLNIGGVTGNQWVNVTFPGGPYILVMVVSLLV